MAGSGKMVIRSDGERIVLERVGRRVSCVDDAVAV